MSQVRRVGWRGAGLSWVAANTLGYALAWAAWERWSQPIGPLLSGMLGGSLTLALYGATLGVGVSVAQALALGRQSVRPLWWIIATMLGFSVSFVVASWVGLAVIRAFPADSPTYLSNGAVIIAFGLSLGAGIGLARWLVLRTQDSAARGWILVSAVCFLLGYGATVGLFQLAPPIEQIALGALFGGSVGAITSIAEWLWLRRRHEAWAQTAAPWPPQGEHPDTISGR
ncbi:MAG TPA: hypothetical protein VF807_07310 [Ktedonobacterales bacterium]